MFNSSATLTKNTLLKQFQVRSLSFFLLSCSYQCLDLTFLLLFCFCSATTQQDAPLPSLPFPDYCNLTPKSLPSATGEVTCRCSATACISTEFHLTFLTEMKIKFVECLRDTHLFVNRTAQCFAALISELLCPLSFRANSK